MFEILEMSTPDLDLLEHRRLAIERLAASGYCMMIELLHDEELGPGTWRGARMPAGRTAIVACPKCGRECSVRQHIIDPDGSVRPSLVCPFDSCDFHRYVRLVGWDPGYESR